MKYTDAAMIGTDGRPMYYCDTCSTHHYINCDNEFNIVMPDGRPWMDEGEQEDEEE